MKSDPWDCSPFHAYMHLHLWTGSLPAVQNLSIVCTTIFATTISTCTLFEKARIGCSKHKRAIWLKFSYPKSPPHPRLVIPKHSSEGHSGICPLSLSTHEAGAAHYLLCFSQNTKFWEHMNCWHTSMKIKKKDQKKPPQNQPQKPPEELPAGQSTLISASPGREVKVCDWLTLPVPVLARKASCDSHVCSPTSHQDLFHSRGWLMASWYSMCYYSLQN